MKRSELYGATVYIDANIFIYAIERHPEFVALLEHFLDDIEDGRVDAVTSELSLAEVLIGAIKVRDDLAVTTYKTLLAEDGPVRMLAVDRPVILRSAEVRAAHGGKLPDAIHVATALEGRCDIFLTNDSKLKRPTELDVVLIAQLDDA